MEIQTQLKKILDRIEKLNDKMKNVELSFYNTLVTQVESKSYGIKIEFTDHPTVTTRIFSVSVYRKGDEPETLKKFISYDLGEACTNAINLIKKLDSAAKNTVDSNNDAQPQANLPQTTINPVESELYDAYLIVSSVDNHPIFASVVHLKGYRGSAYTLQILYGNSFQEVWRKATEFVEKLENNSKILTDSGAKLSVGQYISKTGIINTGIIMTLNELPEEIISIPLPKSAQIENFSDLGLSDDLLRRLGKYITYNLLILNGLI